MKKPVFLILFYCMLFACTKDEVEEIDEFAGDSGTFTDSRDNHVYKWLRIGDKIWMAENLAFIPSVYPPESGSNTEPRYYVYGYAGNDVAEGKQSDNYSSFGVLYNWTAASTASPSGWHLPSDEEWKQLELYLGMTQIQVELTGFRGNEQGLHLKATSTWNKNGNGANTSGFTAFAGGICYGSEGFLNVGIGGYWWSATENSSREAWNRGLYWSNLSVNRYHMSKDYGLSVRCVKD
jgi:uncharacterized protein (TIGR02145 family)